MECESQTGRLELRRDRGDAAHRVAWPLLCLACMPSGDLDAHARGSQTRDEMVQTTAPPTVAVDPGVFGGSPAVSVPLPDPGGASPSEANVAPSGVDGQALPSSGTDASTVEGSNPAAPADAGALPAEPVPGDPPMDDPGTVADAPTPMEPVSAPPLPDDLRDAPVTGEIVFSEEAEWEVDGVFEPTFEVHTPTASYWVVKPLGTIVSIEDRQPSAQQWIAFSSGFRPLRGVPSFPTPPVTRVTTVRDGDSTTPTHLRLTSVSEDEQWHWVWDFYVTHVTFTVNRAPVPFGFAYQGVPGGSLGVEDRLVSNAGESQGARSSFNADLEGPVEWVYLADTTLGRSLFAIQHQDDALPERYVVRDNDTSLLSFGDGLIETLPIRFSLGLMPSTNHAQLTERVEFIAGSIR
jgi:hypothetical protein